ncbi:uncharacterized protein G2W53_008826 [Senna tora]|uniref:Uncharacterized protein n=1 Tax=Senna tora TaxID=362788 RepID=A0A834WXE8_9FABA|nr:uncharacterized protein G2W53_008826 [Senna tora]
MGKGPKGFEGYNSATPPSRLQPNISISQILNQLKIL